MSDSVGNADKDDVRAATDLVALIGEHVPLQRKGREHVGVCPFHDDHSPSLTVVSHKGHAFYKCHSCGAAGDVFRFVMEYHRLSFGEALHMLAERAGLTLRRTPRADEGAKRDDLDLLRRACTAADAFFRRCLRSDEGALARSMLEQRGFDDEITEQWGLGAAPAGWENLAGLVQRRKLPIDVFVTAGLLKRRAEGPDCYDTFRNRLIFPIRSEMGRPIAFGGRQLVDGEEPKYLNSPETPLFSKSKTLYGLERARRAIIDRRRAIVTEGYTDALACHQAGHTNVVATLGTALTRDHVRLLKRLADEVVLVFDGDEAGQRAADRALGFFFDEAVDVRICVLPEGMDPADLLRQADGPERFSEAIDTASDPLWLKTLRFRETIRSTRGLAARSRVLETLLSDLGRLGFQKLTGVRKGPVIGQIASFLEMPIDEIDTAVRRSVPRERQALREPPRGSDEAVPASKELDSPCPSNRRRAERDLLALVIAAPETLETTVGEPAIRVADLLRPEQLLDPGACAVTHALAATEADPTADRLMAAISETRYRSLVADLFLEGIRRVEETDDVDALVRDVARALLEVQSRQQYRDELDAYRQVRSNATQGGDALREIVEKRRRQAYIPDAMPARRHT